MDYAILTRRGVLQWPLLLAPGLAAATRPPALIAGLVSGLNEPGLPIAQKVGQLLAHAPLQGPDWMPWARAVATAAQGNSLIFPLARAPERESAWQWLAPLAQDQLVLVVAPESARSLADPAALHRLRVGAIRSSFILARLQEFGFRLPELAPTELANAKKLALGRIDAWATVRSVALADMHRAYLPGQAQLLTLGHEPISLWLAASPDLDLASFQLPGSSR